MAFFNDLLQPDSENVDQRCDHLRIDRTQAQQWRRCERKLFLLDANGNQLRVAFLNHNARSCRHAASVQPGPGGTER